MNSAQPLSSNCPNFQAQQQQFCAWLREPESQTLLPDVALERMQVYRDLLFDNVCNFIDMVYPVAKSLIPEAHWQLWQQGFFAEYRCTSPFYLDISLHFREYLLGDGTENPDRHYSRHDKCLTLTQDYPWLHELLQYEWLELYLDTMPNVMSNSVPIVLSSNAPDSALTLSNNSVWQLTQPIWVLVYQYPVYHWHVETDLDQVQLEPSPSAVLVWRAADYSVQMRVLSPLQAICLDSIQTHSQQALVQAEHGDASPLNPALLFTADLIVLCHAQCPELDLVTIEAALMELQQQLQTWQLWAQICPLREV